MRAEIKMADSIIGIFQVLTTECCSFMNIGVLQSIMKKYKIDTNSSDDLHVELLGPQNLGSTPAISLDNLYTFV